MSGSRAFGRVAFATALCGALLVWWVLASREIPPARLAVLSLKERGIPDCQREDFDRDGGALGLECWSYGKTGAWRVRGLASAHNALVVRADVTARAAADEMAEAVIGREATRYGEILLYASVVEATRRGDVNGEELVIRTRWTRGSGVSTMEYAQPRAPEENAVLR